MKRCPTCKRTYSDETLTFCLADGALLSAPYDDEATQRITPPPITTPVSAEHLPQQVEKSLQPNVYDNADDSRPKSRKSVFLVGAIIALVLTAIIASVVVVTAIIAVNVSNNSNKNAIAEKNANSATVPAKASLEDAFPQTVGDFTLDSTYTKSSLKGDDKYLPNAEDVMGAVYKSPKKRTEQVMAGSYSSASAAEAARDKRVSASKYVVRWTKGNILYVATDMTFKDKL